MTLIDARTSNLAPFAACVRSLVASLPTRASRLVAIGQTITYAGLVATFAGSLLNIARPSAPPWLNPLGSLLQSTGMLVLGAVALPSDALLGWRRYLPLIVGGWFLAHMPFQFAFFASPSGMPSHTLMMGVWGPLWALLGAVLSSQTHARTLGEVHE